MFGNNYKMVLVKNTGTTEQPLYERVKELKLKLKDQKATWKGLTFYYTLKEIAYRKGRTNYVFKDIDTGDAVLQLGRGICAVPPDDVDEKSEMRLVKTAVQQAGSAYGTIVLILAIVAGFGIGFVLCAAFYPQIFPNAVPHAVQTAKTVIGI